MNRATELFGLSPDILVEEFHLVSIEVIIRASDAFHHKVPQPSSFTRQELQNLRADAQAIVDAVNKILSK